MRIVTLLAAAAVLAIPLSEAAHAGSDGVRKGNRHTVFSTNHRYEQGPTRHHRYAHRLRRSPQVAGFRFAAGGHANGYEYQSYPEFNYGPSSQQFHGYFGYGPNFDNRTFAEVMLGGGDMRSGDSRP
jgi:hypothetical protein